MPATEPTVFKPDYRIAQLSGLGLLGLLLGSFLLFYPDIFSFRKTDSVFHEMVYLPKDLVSKKLDPAVKSLETINKERKEERKKISKSLEKPDEELKKESLDKDSLNNRKADLDSQIATDDSNIKILKRYINYEYTVLSDSESFRNLNKALFFKIEPDLLEKWDDQYQHGDTAFKVDYVFRDPGMSFSISGTDTIRIITSPSDTAFMAKYPTTGIWVLLLLIFCSFLTITISTSIYLNNKILKLFKDNKITGLKGRHYYLYVVITFLALFAFWFIGKKSFNDEDVIRNMFFMGNFKNSMLFIQILGFLGGSFCLAGFIQIAAMLGYFTKSLKDRKQAISVQQRARAAAQAANVPADQNIPAADPAAPPAATPPPAVVPDNPENPLLEVPLDSNEAAQERDKYIYEQLGAFFQTYFILAAIILSLLVLCTGGLYGIVNNMPFIKLLRDDWGYSPAGTDFVYLYGGTYTVILLLVYLPAKMRFSEISFDDKVKKGDNGKDEKWYAFLKEPFTHLKGLLIASSPLLASLIQALFDALF